MAFDYSRGDYRVVAQRLWPAAVHLVDWCGIAAGDRVADVAAGSGNVARLCVDRGATVVALDLTTAQLELGRTDLPTSSVRWVAADAQALPLRAATVDAALSTFGLVYAPDPEQALAESARITRPGGWVALTSWWVDGVNAAGQRITAELTRDPSEAEAAAVWGEVDVVRRRLERVLDGVEVEVCDLTHRYASVDARWELISRSSPPIATMSEAMRQEAGRRLRAMWTEHGRTEGGEFVLVDSYVSARGRAR